MTYAAGVLAACAMHSMNLLASSAGSFAPYSQIMKWTPLTAQPPSRVAALSPLSLSTHRRTWQKSREAYEPASSFPKRAWPVR
jgi:hypothetical protein